MTTLLNALVESTEGSRADTIRILEEEPYYEHESRSISMPEIKLSESLRACAGNKSQIIAELSRIGTWRYGHTCPRLAVVWPLTSIPLEVDGARAVLIIGRSINSLSVLTSVCEFDPVTRKHVCRLAFARVSPQNDPISCCVRVFLLFAFIVRYLSSAYR